jgi:WD40 repeat protein
LKLMCDEPLSKVACNFNVRRYSAVRVWDVASQREVAKLEGHTDAVRSCAWSPGGLRLTSGSSDHTVRVWWGGEKHTFAHDVLIYN